MKASITLLLLLLCATATSQNLLNMDSWIAGTSGATSDYSLQGTAAQNSRVTLTDPYGNPMTVWQSAADGAAGMNGGFSHSGVTLDTSKTYRFTFWMRSTGPNGCTNYAGYTPYEVGGPLITSSERVNGSTSTWPYFFSANLPNDTWYLVVAYIGPSGFTGGSDSGVYNAADMDPNNPTALPTPAFSTTDFRFPSNQSQVNVRVRNFMWSCSAGDVMYSYDPRVEDVTGQITPTAELLYGSTTAPGPGPGGDTVWNTSGNVISYTAGNVGIGTTSPDEALTVKGKIHTEEVRVDLSVPAPDYVFKKEYKLLSLSEIQAHIDTYGHLPNVPSAKEMETKGVELGTMEMKLLEKIEELTLYLLQQNQQIEELRKQVDNLKSKG